jgi:transposase
MGKLSFRPKSTVMVHGKPWRVVRTVSPTEVLLEEAGTHRKEVFDIADLKTASAPAEAPPPAIDCLDENDLTEAKRRLEVIKPLLSIGRGRTKAIDAVAAEYGLGRRTIERWLHNYEVRERLSDLAPRRRKRPMPTRLHPEVETLVAKVIEDFYLTKQNLSPRKAYESLKRLCAGIRRKPPHEETFRRRLDAVPEELKLRRRRFAALSWCRSTRTFRRSPAAAKR